MFRREKRVLSRRYLEQGVPKAEITRRVGVSRRNGLPTESRPASSTANSMPSPCGTDLGDGRRRAITKMSLSDAVVM